MKRKKGRNKILIIDDSRLNIALLTNLLESDYEIYSEDTPEAGLEAAKAFLPDLILCDGIMPRLTGFDVIKILKDDERTSDIPIIFLTGRAGDADVERGFALGAADYIVKPYKPTIVLLRVKVHIENRNLLNQVKNLIMVDELTGLGNRRFFNDELKKEWGRFMRYQWPLSFLLMDIDHFKKINDTYGHAAGDIVLKNVARVLNESVPRITDSVARWGGEEFAIILPNTELDKAMMVAERIRANIGLTTIEIGNGIEVNVAVSVGVSCAVVDRKSGYSLESLVMEADAALYEAKAQGRNRVVAAK